MKIQIRMEGNIYPHLECLTEFECLPRIGERIELANMDFKITIVEWKWQLTKFIPTIWLS